MTIDIKLPFDLSTIVGGFFMLWIYIGHVLLILNIIQSDGIGIIWIGGFLIILPIVISNMFYKENSWYFIMYPYWRIAKALKVVGKYIKEITPYRVHMSDWDGGEK